MNHLQKILPLPCFINTLCLVFLKEVRSSELSVNQYSILEKFLLLLLKNDVKSYLCNMHGQNKVKRCLPSDNETDRPVKKIR